MGTIDKQGPLKRPVKLPITSMCIICSSRHSSMRLDYSVISLAPLSVTRVLITCLDLHILQRSLNQELVDAQDAVECHLSQARSVRTYVRAGRPFLAVLIRVVADNKHVDVLFPSFPLWANDDVDVFRMWVNTLPYQLQAPT
jgi:hypothetical protein